MKTKNLFLAAFAAFALVSCTESEFVGDNSLGANTEAAKDGAIKFAFDKAPTTRADLYGSDAAAKLNNTFVVYGTKHASTEDNTATNDAVVYNNFQVKWTASTAGTTASNTSDWEYVGLQAYDATPTSQAIKYWDYSADKGYTFYAFSAKPADMTFPKAGTDNIQVTKVTTDGSSLYNKGYSVAIKPAASLNDLYFADRLEVPETKYDQTVSLTFRNIGAKVRFGFYETVPGYTVKIDRFYIDDANSGVVTDFATMNDPKTDGFYASVQNVKKSTDQTINVTYYESTTATQVINRPKVSNPTGGYDYYIKLGNGSGIINKTLATTASSPTWVAGKAADNYYIPVFPFEGNTNPLLLKLDFTLTSEDGNGDQIHVRGARAIVPATYVQWKGNFAYTYIFKISDLTNGTTGKVDDDDEPVDPEGLKPITFDAIVVDVTEEKQETITSVANNSITTYAEGAIVNEYKAGEPIYIAVSNNYDTTDPNYEVITPSNIGMSATEARVFKLSGAVTEADVLAQLNGSPMSFTKTPTSGTEAATIGTTVPLVDGTNPTISNVKFTPSAAGYYAYVYVRTEYVAPTYSPATGVYDSGTTYYLKNAAGTYYAVSVPNAAAYADNIAKLFTRATPGTVGVYDVKVIKVQ